MQPASLLTLTQPALKETVSVRAPVDFISSITAEQITEMSEVLIERVRLQINHTLERRYERAEWEFLALPTVVKMISDAFATPLRFVEERLTIPFANLLEEGLLDKIEDANLKKTLIQLRKKNDFCLELKVYVHKDEETGDLSIRGTLRNFREYLPLYKLICDTRK